MGFPRAIIFDWDNTLVDTGPIIAEALNETRRAFGLPEWTVEEVRLQSANSLRDSFPKVFGEDWKKAREIFYAHVEKVHLLRLTALPDSGDLLKWLHEEGVPLFVVSTKRGDLLRKEIEHIGWKEYFAGVTGSLDAPKDKPEREAVSFALSQGGLALDDSAIWFVGDNELDVKTARNSGCTPVLIDGKNIGKGLGVEMLFSTLAALHKMLYNGSKQ